MLTRSGTRSGIAIQVAANIGDIDDALDRLRRLLVLVAAGGVGLAAVLGLLVDPDGAAAGPAADRRQPSTSPRRAT